MIYFYPAVAIVFFAIMLVYFRIAARYNIVDRPNERSSHTSLTIRGGGVIFPIACILIFFLYPAYQLPAAGAVAIGIISFIDDRVTLSSKIRLVVHFTAVTMMFVALGIMKLPVLLIIVSYFFAIGIINVYNFMDGINGITGGYTLAVLAGLQYVNNSVVSFIEPDLIWLPMLANVVFLFFNFRKKAKCFAGDVGSITIAFWIVFLIFKLILQTHDFTYILFLAIYGVESVLTIVQRLMLRQNIFEAHRLHFYQILANEYKVPHLLVSTCYAIAQVIVIIVVIAIPLHPLWKFIVILAPLAVSYVIVKRYLITKHSMLKLSQNK
ncbi:glycosyltransferase family 4 protein [Mucilaginibacter achroorhodeus]|uniref:Glycosyltransferase family 4 protein n=1 Tax=Mucilaginibacter achroorhodeus TaxID=2599294 RepID=A0A563U9K2_9SPHI|nr:glycosyltransferase family 4 protein [Mucilaginibacter achroorhodeus]TWR27996.1 glycosyltransferase family 4 protein [Mucilaginibacter achroorhodeus]